MKDTLPLNDALASEIALLLGVDKRMAQAAADLAPYADMADLAARAPKSVAAAGLDLPKLDVNAASTAQLREVVGSTTAADAIIAARPIYDMGLLRGVTGIGPTIFERLIRVFHAGSLTIWGADSVPTRLEADPGSVVLRLHEDADETEAFLEGGRGLSAVKSEGAYRLFASNESEGAARDVAAMAARPEVDAVLPALRGPDNVLRYADPGYVNVQFTAAASEEEIRDALDLADLTPHRRMRLSGLLVARLRDRTGGLRAVSRAVAILQGHPRVEIAEPAWIGFDDMEGAEPGNMTPARATVPKTQGTEAEGGVGPVFDHVTELRLDDLWTLTQGSPDVTVVVVDTGWDVDHPALTGRDTARDGADWNFVTGETDAPQDTHGHGTFVNGLIGGNGALGVRGVAPGARLLALRVPMFASLESYARRREAILSAAALAAAGGRVVVNCSWRTAGDVALIRRAIEDAASAGALIVASAGNDAGAGDAPHYPSDYETVISVGATGIDGGRAAYSQFGARVDLAAPGGEGPVGPNLLSAALGGGARVDWGTSFSAALVSGFAALIWSAAPQLKAIDVRTVLLDTARPLPAGSALGAGALDATALAAWLSGTVPPELNSEPDPASECPMPELIALDGLDADDLIQNFGLLPLTARLLVHRRPFRDWQEVRAILGMTDAAFEGLRARVT